MFTEKNGQTPTVKLVQPGEGDSFSMLGIQVTPKATAEDTHGAYSLIEQVVSPGSGSPAHILHSADKIIYVVEGEFAILLGAITKIALSGASAVIPRGTVHNFKNIGTSKGKILVITSPAGHEQFLRELSQLAQTGSLNPETMQVLGQTHHVENVSPPKA